MFNNEEKINYIRQNINPNRFNNWKHVFSTNCYAFALGIDISENTIKKYAYQPGVMAGKVNGLFLKYIPYQLLIKNIYDDMNKLGIEIREVGPSDMVDINEWKIALFTENIYISSYELVKSFHFLRQSSNGEWYHKEGYLSVPTNKDDNHEIITNPTNCYLKNQTFNQCYCLKRKK